MISNLLFAKDQTSKVTKGELQMLYSGVEDEIRRARAGIPIQSVQTNHGYFRINLHLYTVNHKIEYVYTTYLIACHILRDETTYKFTDKEGNMLYCKLPQTHLTNFSTLENIRFLPDLEFLCAETRAPPPDADMDDVEDITPDDAAAYDLGPLDEDADDATYRRWMVDFQRKNNSLMKRILKAITGGCFRGHERRASE
ncbi:hypothetical protein F2Q70_00035801 [Brassica cretica]|uniref:Arabidopsis retrotransposon Orf1 C-terminal domain-containing protein n=1 Tax=Brassica cretica TaxID=69181 RepID=A0A8S9JZ41_BRACR|nr:hypothetical protein F2Q70_00035801 [Brassica cretica]